MSLEDQLRDLIDSSPPHIQRHFACDCAERALKAANVRDERSWNAIEVSRRYAEGRANFDELNTARAAARAAAWAAADAAWAAAWAAEYAANAAWVAARAAADAADAAWAAARSAVGSAARSAVGSAVWNAERNAVWSAERNAERNAVWNAAWDQECAWQIAHLQYLIATHNATRSALLFVLQQRAESINPIFTQYAQSLEERVFE